MVKVYKVHPGIGIARVGNSPDEFFVSSEVLGGNPVDIVSGVERPLQKYKDASGHIKRQAARFRVFEYEDDTSGTITPLREITLADAQIEWRVSLANRKASALKWRGSGVRNPSEIDRAELEIKPVFKPISGANQIVTATTPGFFRGKEVYLGELRTDAQGHLMLLGGRGLSSSEPSGRLINDFANNDDWYDDIADGPIDAQITFPSGETFTVVGGWVIVAPPDFAPKVAGLTTLYDIAFQAAVNQGWLIPPPTPSFRQDILPTIERGANLCWVDEWDTFQPILQDLAILASKTNPIADSLRQAVFDQLDTASDTLKEHEFTQVQKDILNKWLGKDFVDDFSSPSPASTLTPSNLDRAALEQGVGGGFNPGIEAGILMTNTAIYTEPFRLTRSPFIDNGSSVSLEAGSITARMAVPWQADFRDCGSTWWPSQRPATIMLNVADDKPEEDWIPFGTPYTQIVENFGKLGFIVPRLNSSGETVFVEDERDPTFPH